MEVKLGIDKNRNREAESLKLKRYPTQNLRSVCSSDRIGNL